jgi:peptidoglycan/xylan/chitin deacetylase (PgdA/CDA1 family)
MDKRLLAARVLDKLGLVEGLLKVRRITRAPVISILSYHRVGDAVGDPYDKGVMDVSPADFDRQVAFLARHFTFIGIDELCAALVGGPLPANPVMITFDDGYRACHDVALPILQRHGAKAATWASAGSTGGIAWRARSTCRRNT